jgi:hypothetical protein
MLSSDTTAATKPCVCSFSLSAFVGMSVRHHLLERHFQSKSQSSSRHLKKTMRACAKLRQRWFRVHVSVRSASSCQGANNRLHAVHAVRAQDESRKTKHQNIHQANTPSATLYATNASSRAPPPFTAIPLARARIPAKLCKCIGVWSVYRNRGLTSQQRRLGLKRSFLPLAPCSTFGSMLPGVHISTHGMCCGSTAVSRRTRIQRRLEKEVTFPHRSSFDEITASAARKDRNRRARRDERQRATSKSLLERCSFGAPHQRHRRDQPSA